MSRRIGVELERRDDLNLPSFTESFAESYDVDKRVSEIAKEHNLNDEQTRTLERLLKRTIDLLLPRLLLDVALTKSSRRRPHRPVERQH